jgi:hypothetical protein
MLARALWIDSLLARALSGQILFRGGFGTGDLSQWEKTGTRGQNIKPGNVDLVSDIVRRGQYAAGMTIHPADVWNERQLRVQLGGSRITVEEGAETFLRFSLFVAKAPQDRDNFFSWEGAPPPARTMQTLQLASGTAWSWPSAGAKIHNRGESGSGLTTNWHSIKPCVRRVRRWCTAANRESIAARVPRPLTPSLLGRVSVGHNTCRRVARLALQLPSREFDTDLQ